MLDYSASQGRRRRRRRRRRSSFIITCQRARRPATQQEEPFSVELFKSDGVYLRAVEPERLGAWCLLFVFCRHGEGEGTSLHA